MAALLHADLVIFANQIIPVVPRDVVLENHAVVVKDMRIIDVLPREQVAAKYEAASTKDLKDHVLIPGLVNAHTHSAMTLLRGLSDDKSLCDWLAQDIWPTEGKFVSPQFVKDGMTHAAAEMIRGGTTCSNDMFFFPQQAIEVLERVGMRGAVGQTVMEFPTAYASGPDEYFEKALPFLKQYKDHDLIVPTMAPHAPYTVGEASLQKVDALSKEHNVHINIHLHETHDECHDSEHQIKASMNCHQS
ncbi:5-methylthioadenosine/s-adenosylhomocysteine deaminase, partial [Globisporangium polare]